MNGEHVQGNEESEIHASENFVWCEKFGGEAEACNGGDDGKSDKLQAVSDTEEMAFLQRKPVMDFPAIEQAVGHVDDPDTEEEYDGFGDREACAVAAGEEKRPNEGDGRSIEAQETAPGPPGRGTKCGFSSCFVRKIGASTP